MSHLFDPNNARSTLVDFLRWRADNEADKIAYIFLLDGADSASSVTYAELDRQARAIAAQLQNLCAVGERALLLYPPGLEYIAAFFGCLYAGILGVPSYPPRLSRSDPRLQAIMSDSQATLALTTAAILGELGRRFVHAPELARLQWVATDQLADSITEAWQEPAISSESVAFLQYTSGSTSTPKGVMISHSNLLHNLSLIRRGFEHTLDSQGVIWLPPYHDMGLIGGILQPLYVGFPVVLMAPVAFLQSPFRWLQAISRYRATTSGGPHFAYDLCIQKITPEQSAALNLRAWEVAFCGAEPIRPATLERFTALFAPCGFHWEAFYPCYGLAEATLMVSGGAKGAPPVICSFGEVALVRHHAVESSALDEKVRALVGCGSTLSDQKVVIADPQTCARCPPGQVGEIWVAGQSISQGYWNRPAETAEAFGAYLKDTREGPFLRTGDLGFWHDDELFITGRLKDLMIIRGRNQYPQDIESTIEQSHPGVRSGFGAAFSVDVDGEERVVVVQEVHRHYRNVDIEEMAGAIRRAVAEEHELHIYAVALIKPGSLPKTSSGKIQRHACRNQFLANSLDVVGISLYEPTYAPAAEHLTPAALLSAEAEQRRSLLEAYLQRNVAEIVRLPPAQVDVHQPLSSLGLDSLMAIELQHRLERDLNIDLPMVSFLEGASPGQLADRMLNAPAPPAPRSAVMPARSGAVELPLSHGQQAIWFLHQLAPEKAVYNIPVAVRNQGYIQPAVLTTVLHAIVRRHATLRTAIATVDGQPVQVISPEPALHVPILDLHSLPASERDAAAERLARQEAQRPFNLAKGPLLRSVLIRLAPADHIVVLVMHHIISDGWSMNVLVQELAGFYAAYSRGEWSPEGPAPLPDLPILYADFACWQRAWLQSEAFETQMDYWAERLKGIPALLDLPTDHPRPAIPTFQGGRRAFRLSPDLARALRSRSQEEAVTLFMILLAAFQTLLAHYSGADDIPVGSPIANRSRADLTGLIGFFVNTLVLRGDLSEQPSFRQLLRRTREAALGAYAHQDLPFELIVNALQPERDVSRSPLFQVMFTLQDDPLRSQALSDLTLRSVEVHNGTAKFDLTLAMQEDGDGISGSLEFSSDLFDVTTIARMLGHFQVLLEALMADPDQPIAHVSLLTAGERQQLLYDWNATDDPIPQGLVAQCCFETQVARTPDALAVSYLDRSLTYALLDARASQLGHFLQQLGVGPETLVPCYLHRSPELLIAILGVLKAGGAYVPLDPAYRSERLSAMLRDLAAARPRQPLILLTQQDLLGQMPQPMVRPICLDTGWNQIAQQPIHPPRSGATPDNLAYVIYTSGSTGRPKGVMITHHGLVNYLTWTRKALPLDQGQGSPVHTSISFDLTVTSLFTPLLAGRRVLLLPETLAAEALAQTLQQERDFSLIKLTPAHLQFLSERLAPQDVQGRARALVVGGENLLADQIAFWRTFAPDTRIVNEYGPTEMVVGCCCYWAPLSKHLAGVIPIGRPIINTRLYVLDRHLQPVPVGVPGELFIGGAQMARGYLDRPDLTAERFVPNPFVGGNKETRRQGDKETSSAAEDRGQSAICNLQSAIETRLYRSGDLARWRTDGELECLGRIDFQVKIRGFRIEPGEIEATLLAHPQIGEAAVWVWEEGGSKRLVVYVVQESGARDQGAGEAPMERLPPDPRPLIPELRAYLKEQLPDYMVPATFVFLEALPLLPNGKLNRSALPVPSTLRPERGAVHAAPKTEAEQTIAAIWQEVLHLEQVGRYDNFFELGGDSITSIQIVSRMSQQGLNVRPQHIFQYQTVAELAQKAVPADAKPGELDTPVSGQVDLTPIQHWFFEQALHNVHCFSQTITLHAEEALDTQALRVSLQKVLDHHDALRMRYTRQPDGWRQYNHSVGEAIALEIVDLLGIGRAEAEVALEQAKSRIRAGIDIIRGPLFKAGLFRLEEGHASLFLACHHLVVDGVSWRTIIDDLIQGYRQALQDQSIRLAPKTLSFLDWSKQLSAYAQTKEATNDLDYWRAALQQCSFALPIDHAATEHPTGTSDTITVQLSPDATKTLLRTANRAYRTGINDLLIVALTRALHGLTGQENIAISLEWHGRDTLGEGAAIARTIGWFTTLFPLVLNMSRSIEVAQQIKYIKESIRQVPAKGLSFGALKYLSCAVETRDIASRFELPAILFNYLGQVGGVQGDLFQVLEYAGQPLPVFAKTRHVIEIIGLVFDDHLCVDFNYHSSAYNKKTITTLVQRFQEELAVIAAHCIHQEHYGFTPSDFPLLRTSQRELDQLHASLTTMQLHDRTIEDIYPLSSMQQGMLLYALFAPSSFVSFQQFSFTLEGFLDRQAFEQAWNHMIEQHPSLRTLFDWQHFAQPVQIVLRENPSAVGWYDLSHITGEAQEQKLAEYQANDRARWFDLAGGPLIRIHIFKVEAQEFRCFLSLQHIISDGWSFPLLFESMFQNYEALRHHYALPSAPARQYKDYIAWLSQQDKTEAQAFWHKLLGDFKTPTPLPIDSYPSGSLGQEAAERTSNLSAELTAGLKDFANRHHVTLNTVFQAAWSILLCQYTRQQDIVFGVAVSGRPGQLTGIEKTIGLFINNLPMRVWFDDDKTISAFLTDIQEVAVAMRNYEYSSLPDIQACSSVPASKKLFNSLIVFQNYPMNEKILSLTTDFKLKNLKVKEMAHYDLTIMIYNLGIFRLGIQYDPNNVEEATISRILDYFETLLAYLIHHPHARLSELRATLDTGIGLASVLDSPPEQISVQPSPIYRAHTDMEKTVAGVWQEVLGIDEIDIRDNFLHIGANSLIIATVHARLQEATHKQFPIISMFKYPTVTALAEYLGQQQIDSPVFEQATERAKIQKAAIDKQRALTKARMKR